MCNFVSLNNYLKIIIIKKILGQYELIHFDREVAYLVIKKFKQIFNAIKTKAF